jgi:hypothetical protein
MDWDFVGKYILPAVIGAGTGLFSPWANWGIEKRRQKLAYRRQLVADWRSKLIPLVGPGADWAGTRNDLLNAPEFASLKPHLKREIATALQARRVRILGNDFPLSEITSEIARIERKWGLV